MTHSLDELKAICEKAIQDELSWVGQKHPNAIFLRTAFTALPELIAEVERLRDALEQISTRSATGIDEANYPIQKFPSMIEIIKIARVALGGK